MRIISWRRRIRFELWWWLWRRYVRFFLLWFQCISLHMTHQMIRGDMGALLFIYHLMTFYHFLIIHVAISQTNTNHDVQPIIMSTNLLSCGCWSCWIRLKNGVRLTGIVIYWGVSDQDKYIIWYVNTRGSRRNCRTLVYFDGDWAACEYDNGICVHIHHLCKILTFILLWSIRYSVMEQMLGYGVYKDGSRKQRHSRIRSNESDDDVAVYVGPSGSDTIYTVPLSAVSIINASGTSHQYSTESKQGDMDVSLAQTRWNCI